MHQEMQREELRPIRQPVVNVEQEPMECIFQYRPDDISNEETHHSLSDRIWRNCGQCVEGQRGVHEEIREGRGEL